MWETSFHAADMRHWRKPTMSSHSSKNSDGSHFYSPTLQRSQFAKQWEVSTSSRKSINSPSIKDEIVSERWLHPTTHHQGIWLKQFSFNILNSSPHWISFTFFESVHNLVDLISALEHHIAEQISRRVGLHATRNGSHLWVRLAAWWKFGVGS